MHILVCPHELTVGGSQINALELAREAQIAGHRITVYAAPGVLVGKVREFGLDYVAAPVRKYPLDLRAVNALTQVVRRLSIDLVHAYEWPASLEAAYGPVRSLRTPAVMTVLSMDVPDFLPKHLPIIVGTHGLAQKARARGRDVQVIEPPIDVKLNSPRAIENARAVLGLGPDRTVISVVGRLSTEHEKYRGVLQAIDVVDRMAFSNPVTLVVAGDGEGMSAVRSRADEVNTRHRAPVIEVTGNLLDPRPAYAAADIVLGMGASALKGLAFSKPLIVQGAAGFWRLLTPETQDQFLADGFFGHGGDGPVGLETTLRDLLADPARRTELGTFGRSLVERRFDVEQAGQRLTRIYSTAREATVTKPQRLSLAKTTYEFAKFRASLQLQAARRALRAEAVHV